MELLRQMNCQSRTLLCRRRIGQFLDGTETQQMGMFLWWRQFRCSFPDSRGWTSYRHTSQRCWGCQCQMLKPACNSCPHIEPGQLDILGGKNKNTHKSNVAFSRQKDKTTAVFYNLVHSPIMRLLPKFKKSRCSFWTKINFLNVIKVCSLTCIKQTISGLTAAIVAQQMLVLDEVNLYIRLFQIVLQGKNINQYLQCKLKQRSTRHSCTSSFRSKACCIQTLHWPASGCPEAASHSRCSCHQSTSLSVAWNEVKQCCESTYFQVVTYCHKTRNSFL